VDKIDYTKHTELELVEMFGRMDPRYAPAECARLAKYLSEQGYIVTEGALGPGQAVPAPAKLQTLIGSPRSIECTVSFGHSAGLFRWLEPSRNDFGFTDSETLVADGIYLRLTGRRAGLLGLFGTLFQREVALSWGGMVDVESDENVVYFSYHSEDSTTRGVTLWLPDSATVDRLIVALPKTRTPEFRAQLKAHADFERNLIAQSSKTPVTVALVSINVLVFVAMGIAGAGRFVPNAAAHLAWGSNFGPYTTDGHWLSACSEASIIFASI
jgi:hypothetical protein